MRHSQLRAFHYVAVHGGFSNAAQVLKLTQPAISEQVKNLEQNFDVHLFRRDRRNVKLTVAGAALFQLTRQYFEIEQQIEDLLSESGAGLSGELRIVADSAYHIAQLLARFKSRFPNVTLSVMTGNTEAVLTSLRNYEAEIGVLGSLDPGKDLETLNLGSTEIVAFCAKDCALINGSAVGLADLANIPLVLREEGSKTRLVLETAARNKGVVLKPAIVAEGREAVRAIVATGAGIGFVSQAEFGDDGQFRKIRLTGVNIHMDESIVYLSQRRDVRLIRAFRDVASTSGLIHAATQK